MDKNSGHFLFFIIIFWNDLYIVLEIIQIDFLWGQARFFFGAPCLPAPLPLSTQNDTSDLCVH